jgi:hypothetical protein
VLGFVYWPAGPVACPRPNVLAHAVHSSVPSNTLVSVQCALFCMHSSVLCCACPLCVQSVGYSVARHRDLSLSSLKRVLSEAAAAAHPGTTMVVYFCGHGSEARTPRLRLCRLCALPYTSALPQWCCALFLFSNGDEVAVFLSLQVVNADGSTGNYLIPTEEAGLTDYDLRLTAIRVSDVVTLFARRSYVLAL